MLLYIIGHNHPTKGSVLLLAPPVISDEEAVDIAIRHYTDRIQPDWSASVGRLAQLHLAAPDAYAERSDGHARFFAWLAVVSERQFVGQASAETVAEAVCAMLKAYAMQGATYGAKHSVVVIDRGTTEPHTVEVCAMAAKYIVAFQQATTPAG